MQNKSFFSSIFEMKYPLFNWIHTIGLSYVLVPNLDWLNRTYSLHVVFCDIFGNIIHSLAFVCNANANKPTRGMIENGLNDSDCIVSTFYWFPFLEWGFGGISEFWTLVLFGTWFWFGSISVEMQEKINFFNWQFFHDCLLP